MEMTGSRQLPASQAEVWRKLNDVDVLKRCIPGCESLEKTDDTHLKAVAALRIGPMSVKFTGDVELQDLKPPNSYRIAGSGKGGPAGFATGYADVTLTPEAGGTLLSYAVNSTVGGKIAQLGGRLIDATAAQLAGQFFDKFTAEFDAPLAANGVAANGAVVPSSSAPTIASGLPSWLVWGGAAILIALAIYFVVTR